MKTLKMALALLLTLCLFAGCGNNNGMTKDGKFLVRFMVGGSEGELAGYRAAVDAFNGQSPDTFVELVGLPNDGFNEKLMTQLSSKTAPDCFYSQEITFGELNNSGKLLDLGPYLDEGKYGLSRADIPQSLQEFATHNGMITGVPVDCNPMVVYYNVDMFSELGLKSPQAYVDEGNWNFAAMQEVSEQLRDAGKHGFIFERWWGPLYSFLLSSGDSVYNAEGTASNFDSPRMLEGLTYLDNNIKSGAFTYAGRLQGEESPDKMFMSSQAGLIYAGRWFVPTFKDIDINWDVVPFPGIEKSSDAISPMPSTPLVINKDAKHPDAVWQFMSFYCGKPGQEIRVKDGGNAVPTVPGLDSLVLSGVPEHGQYFLDAVQLSFAYPDVEAVHPRLTDAIMDEAEKMMVGEQSPAETAAAMKQVADSIINN